MKIWQWNATNSSYLMIDRVNVTNTTYRTLDNLTFADNTNIAGNLTTKGFILNTTEIRHDCGASTRGDFWSNQSAAGSADVLWWCAKDSSDNYNWVQLAIG